MKDIKNIKEQDLIKTLNEKRTGLRNFRFGSTGSKTRNVKEALSIRKSIAQILTELRARKA
ncbi:MAG: hypothetical protein RJA61_41 [Candidatus Parcubacteria bacterium]|jgi:ribosomal protein L29